MDVLDFFCGAGGLSLGFEHAGYNIIAGIDNDLPALKTFEYNHDNALPLNIDLFDDNFLEEIELQTGQKKFDVIIGGPPCQGFSLTGPRNFHDKRNRLYLSMLKAVDYFQPKAFVIENVNGIATLYKGAVKERIIKECEKLGYEVTYGQLLAADYGVPQMRKRIFFVGIRKDLKTKFEFPTPTHTPDIYVSCEEAISDLPSLENDLGNDISVYEKPPMSGYQIAMRQECDTLYNHVGTRHTDAVKNVIAQVPEGGNHKDLPPGVGESRKFNEAWTRYHSKKPSKTIDTGHRNHFHYKWHRVPTIRENARLQSFPDSFRFLGTKTQQNKQVGNAVPPLLAYHIAKALKTYLDNA
jgi:DNA (cytosine-5)-methyltransferase 1